MWKVAIKKKALKNLQKLPISVVELLKALSKDLKTKGPYPGDKWPNYSKLLGKNITVILITDTLHAGKLLMKKLD